MILWSGDSQMTLVLGSSIDLKQAMFDWLQIAQSSSVPEGGVESFEPTRMQPIMQFEFLGKRKGMSKTTLKWETE